MFENLYGLALKNKREAIFMVILFLFLLSEVIFGSIIPKITGYVIASILCGYSFYTLRAFEEKRTLIVFLGGMLFSTFFNIVSMDYFQLFRNQLLSLLAPFCGLVTYIKLKKYDETSFLRVIDFLVKFLLVISILIFVEIFTGWPVGLAYIRSQSDGIHFLSRYYLLGFELTFFLVPILIILRRYYSFTLLIIVGLLTQGKIVLIVMLIGIVIGCLYMHSLSARDRMFFAFIVMLILAVFLSRVYIKYDDYLTFLLKEVLNPVRTHMAQDALDKISTSLFRSFFGIGLGVPYTDGYAFFVSPPRTLPHGLIYNSKHDIECGYLFLLLRYGLIGFILYFTMLFKFFGKAFYRILPILLVSFITMSPVGPSWVIIYCGLGLLSAFLDMISTKKLT